MAAEAGSPALGDDGGADLDLVCFASTTAPYAEKSSAAVLAAVLDCGPAVSVADLGGSLRAGTTGLRLALDAVRAGSAREALVAAADVRLAPPGSDVEADLGRRRGGRARRAGGWRHRAARGRGVPHPRVLRRLAARRRALSRAGRPDVRPRLRVRAADGRGGAAPPRRDRRRAGGDPARGRVRAGRAAGRADPPEPRPGRGRAPAGAAARPDREHGRRLAAPGACRVPRGGGAGRPHPRRRLRLGSRRAPLRGDRPRSERSTGRGAWPPRWPPAGRSSTTGSSSSSGGSSRRSRSGPSRGFR